MAKNEDHYFISYLESLRDREDRGALAALRRGLGEKPGSMPAMYPYVVPKLPQQVKPWQEKAYYLVASLFAYHPKAGGKGNMGTHFAATTTPQNENTAVERRFTSLLAAHPEDLPFYLRQAVSYLSSKDVPINWNQLFVDIQAWGHLDRYVQKRWARAFWGRDRGNENNE